MKNATGRDTLTTYHAHAALASLNVWAVWDTNLPVRHVLITGGAGFIGSHLCDRLLERGISVVVVDNFSSGSQQNLTPHERLQVIRGDIRELSRLPVPGDIDTVFHLAALISGQDSLRLPDEYLDVNVRGTLEVIRFCHARGATRLIFASSSTVYGQPTGDAPRRETDVPRPWTVYAASKLTAEHLIQLYAPQSGYTATSLRLFNVYGPRQSPDHPYANVTCKFAHAAARGKSVALYGDGSQSRDFVFVDDVTDAFQSVAPGSARDVYNVGTGSTTRIIDLLRLAADAAGGVVIDVERRPPWPNDVQTVRADTALLHEEFNLSARVAMPEGLARTVKYFRETAL